MEALSMVSVEKPFLVELWPIFNKVATTVTGGRFIPDEFEFVVGETALSTLSPVLTMIGIYYLVIFGGNYVWKKAGWKPLVLNGPFQIHNVILTTVSLALLLLMAEQLIPMIYKHGLFYAICAKGAYTQKMVVLYYLNYLVKFLEFVDTVFLVVKQKKLTFLHTYHHGATALLCYTQLIGQSSISWVVIILNLGVHVVMYWYYFLAARGIRVWWKEWVTRFQIIQFILDLGFVYFGTYLVFVNRVIPQYKDKLPNCGDCSATASAAVTGCAILSSYLVLFIAFYIEVYRKQGLRKSNRVKAVKGGVAAQMNEYVHASGRELPAVEGNVKLRKS